MDAGQSRASRFVTLPGLLFLFICAVTAIYFRAAKEAVFLLFFFLLCLGARAWSRAVLSRVEVSVEPLAASCHAGEMLRLGLTVRNHSFFPLVWLDVILPLGERALVRGEEEKKPVFYELDGEPRAQAGVRERFVWLLWQQEIRFEERMPALRRGAASLSSVYLQAGDGFGLSARARRLPLAVPLRLLVFPRVVPVRVQPFLRISQEAVASRRGQAEDITVLRGSRPYAPGDPVRRINWRTLAASGRMEVKLYQTVQPGCAAFVLEAGSFVRMEKRKYENGTASDELVPVLCGEELEQMLSLIASCIKGLSERGMPCALILPACAGQEPSVVLPQGGRDSAPRCMEALACFRYDGKEARFPWETFRRARRDLGDLYLCTRMEGRSELEEKLAFSGCGRVRRIVLEKGTGGDCLYAGDLALAPLAVPQGSEPVCSL